MISTAIAGRGTIIRAAMSKRIRRSALVTDEQAGGNVSDLPRVSASFAACRTLSLFLAADRQFTGWSFHSGSCPTAALISFSSTKLQWWSVRGPNSSLPISLPIRISSARDVIRDMCQMFWVSLCRSCLTNPCPFATYGAAQRLLGLRASLRNLLFRQECRQWRQR